MKLTPLQEFTNKVIDDIDSKLVTLNTLNVDEMYYGFAVSSFLWYKARLYIGFFIPSDSGSVLLSIPELRGFSRPQLCYIDSSSHATRNGAMAKIAEYESRARRGDYINCLPQRLSVMRNMRELEKNWHFHLDLPDFIIPTEKDVSHLVIGADSCVMAPSNPSAYLLQMIVSYQGEIIDWATVQGYTINFKYCGASFDLQLHFVLYYEYEWKETSTTTDSKGNTHSETTTHTDYRYVLIKFFILYGRGESSGNRTPLLCTTSFPNLEQTLGALFARNLEAAITSKTFFRHFTTEIMHKRKDWRDLDACKLSELFSCGSVLLVKRKSYMGLLYHASVYLGCDLVIHVHVGKDSGYKGKIFQFAQFKDFMKPSDEVIDEYRFDLRPYDKNELIARATEMNEKEYVYNLRSNNCEHLAFELAVGIHTSTQMECLLKWVVAGILSSASSSK